jgi:hypothetical protein
MIEHKDILGRAITSGMLVAFAYKNCLHLGKVGKISNVMIRVHGLSYKCKDGRLVYPEQVTILDSDHATLYLLSNAK